MTTDFVDIKTVIKEFNIEAKIWRKERILGDVRHDKKNKCLWINIPKTRSEYLIELNRIETPQEAFHWLCHLTEKDWFTPQMTFDLIEVIKRVTTVNEYCCPEIWENINIEPS